MFLLLSFYVYFQRTVYPEAVNNFKNDKMENKLGEVMLINADTRERPNDPHESPPEARTRVAVTREYPIAKCSDNK